MTYGIMRVEKRGRSAVYGLQMEANRTQEDHEQGRDFDRSDIDWSRTKNNIQLRHTERWNEEITRQLRSKGIKERKDSIVMLDGLYTASGEWFERADPEEIAAYFRDCYNFHVQEFCQGDRSRVINAVIHFDETTPHMHVASVPLIEDEKGPHLSAKRVMGDRGDYRLRQDRFFDQVTKSRGMARGEVREPSQTKAHVTKRDWQIAKQEERFQELTEASKQLEEAIGSLTGTELQHSGLKTDRNGYIKGGQVPLKEYDQLLTRAAIGDSIGSKYARAVLRENDAKERCAEIIDEAQSQAVKIKAKARLEGLKEGLKETLEAKYSNREKEILWERVKEEMPELCDDAIRQRNMEMEIEAVKIANSRSADLADRGRGR